MLLFNPLHVLYIERVFDIPNALYDDSLSEAVKNET
jgi:hypothetical protein